MKMQIIERLAPTDGNCRPCIQRSGFLGITIHNTSNYSYGANALAHANLLRNGWKYVYTSWNYVVDDTYAVRCVPENEVAWCQGDGYYGDGNNKTISIEICDNSDGDILKATDNAAELAADILKRNGVTNAGSYLFQHNYWTGKDCPYDIRRGNPYDWNTFVNKVQAILDSGKTEVVDQVLHIGSRVMFNGVFTVNEIKLPGKKYPNGAIGCYATCYGSPVGVNDWIPCGPLAECNADGSNPNYNAILNVGDFWCCNKIFTVVDVELPTRYTPNGVATLEADGVRFRVDCGPLLEV